MSGRLVATVKVRTTSDGQYHAEVIDDNGDGYASLQYPTVQSVMHVASGYVEELSYEIGAEDASN